MTYAQYGDENVVELAERPIPKVGPSQIRIRITRASINPVDWKLMSGLLDGMIEARFPVIPGWDAAGVVDAVGPDTPEFTPGERVAAYTRLVELAHGTFADYITVPVEFVARIPDGVSDDQAAALPLVGLTARRSIQALQLTSTDTVLIHAASGGVGYLACQLAAAAGATVIGTASQVNFAKLEAIGVTPVAHGDGLVERVGQAAPDGITAVVDCVGQVRQETSALLGDSPRRVSIADPGVVDDGGRWIWVRPDGAGLQELLDALAEGALQLDIDSTIDLEELAAGLARSRQGRARGKIVVRVAQ